MSSITLLRDKGAGGAVTPALPIRLAAIDLDGTLLDPEHQVSAANEAALDACLRAGVEVVLASGRSYASMRPFGTALGLPLMICLNGAAFGDAAAGTVRARRLLSPLQVALVSQVLQARGTPFCVFGVRDIYCLPGAADPLALAGYGEPAMRVVPALTPEHVPDPIKILAFLTTDQREEAALARLTAPHVTQIRTHHFFLEWMPPGVGKGDALAELMAERGLARDEVLSIGDGENDLTMFAAAGVSVAMAGAPPSVAAAARYTTASNAEDGVALALRRFVLARLGRGA